MSNAFLKSSDCKIKGSNSSETIRTFISTYIDENNMRGSMLPTGGRPVQRRGKVCDQAALVTFPALIQLVHTLIFRTHPFFMTARTLWRLGLNRLLFKLWAWLTLFPTTGFFPQIAHSFDICPLLIERSLNQQNNPQ